MIRGQFIPIQETPKVSQQIGFGIISAKEKR